jgi:type IV secretory pathway VirJ component
MFALMNSAITDPVGQAQAAQEMLNKNVYTAVIVGLGILVLALGAWVLRLFHALSKIQEQRVTDKDTLGVTQEKRIADRDAFQTKLSRDIANIIKEYTQANFALTLAVNDIRENCKLQTMAMNDLRDNNRAQTMAMNDIREIVRTLKPPQQRSGDRKHPLPLVDIPGAPPKKEGSG